MTETSTRELLAEALDPALEPSEPTLRKHLGVPAGASLDGAPRQLIDRGRELFAAVGRPWSWVVEADVAEVDGATTRLVVGAELHDPRLADELRAYRAPSIVIVAASAGAEVDGAISRLWDAGLPDEAMALAARAAGVAETVRDLALARARRGVAERGGQLLRWRGPGHDGWPLADLTALVAALRATGDAPGPLEALGAGGLAPARSTIVVATLAFEAKPHTPVTSTTAAARPAESSRRSFPLQALEAWSRRRLTWTRDGELRVARFRFDGTTCASLGLPLAFDYEIVLDGDERVVRAACRVCPDDTGHAGMCAYLFEPESFLARVTAQPPWVGAALAEAIEECPRGESAGCLCTAANRDHKWRMALETVSHALTTGEGPSELLAPGTSTELRDDSATRSDRGRAEG